MTARQPPRPDGLNAIGTGKGLKKVTVPVTKKRGASKDRAPHIEANRAKYTSLSNIPASEVAERYDPNTPLTDKAKAFVRFWAQGESITSASARAGYGDGATYAYKVARTPQAIALYNQEKLLFEQQNEMSRKKVMDGILEGIEMAKLLAEPASVINGWKTIGQMCGYFEPIRKKIEVSVTGGLVMHKLEQMSDAQLLDLLSKSSPEMLEEVLSDEDEA